MPKPQIFVSCGQRTAEEKKLASDICTAIREDRSFDFFFAEFQSNLHGLNENILDALQRTAGFIAVMHRRGEVSFGDRTALTLIRASVWIEQEIAIAAYIQQTTKRQLLTAAYIEGGVGREGIRELLHLNPITFTQNAEVLADIKSKLSIWSTSGGQSSPSDDEFGTLELRHSPRYEAHVGRVVDLKPFLSNKGSRAKEYACTLEVPSQLLSWSNASYYVEVTGNRAGYRRFRVTEETKQRVPILKDQELEMLVLNVSITHLKEPERHGVLAMPIYVLAELESHSYDLTVPCTQVFEDAVPFT
jgi:hypothetical protein